MAGYLDQAQEFEKKWQSDWAENKIFRTANPGDADFDAAKPKFSVLDMFPYPSGVGLHVGHPLGYIATDVIARCMRMRGYNVLHSMGFDAFGLPAEQYALQTNQHPRVTTDANIENMLSQLRILGLFHDEDRRFATTDADYYRWTQWIFLQLFHSFYDETAVWQDAKGRQVTGRARPISELRQNLQSGTWGITAAGDVQPVGSEPSETLRAGADLSKEEIEAAVNNARLALVEKQPVNWCPMLGTVLSNEEVTNEGKSERGDYPVYKRPLEQWVLRITKYADRLSQDLDEVDWPQGVVDMQRGWIGRSEGAELDFLAQCQDGSEAPLAVYTTRPDTLFGASFMVMAPDHPLVGKLTSDAQKEIVAAYQKQAAEQAALQAQDRSEKEKTGVFTGSFAINPVTGEKIQIWIADYVLMGYGSGAIMAVPAHDQRDFDFAKQFDLPIKAVVQPDMAWLAENAPADCADAASAYQQNAGDFTTAFTGNGTAINSENDQVSLNGLAVADAKQKMIDWLVRAKIGVARTQYKLRDWGFSRQRYWGEPFPVLRNEAGKVFAIAQDQLPVVLPEISNFQPEANEDPESDPVPPLARATDWMHVKAIQISEDEVRIVEEGNVGEEINWQGQNYKIENYRRDPNSMPNWAGSCWYYLRYFDAKNDQALAAPEILSYWENGRAEDPKANGAIDLYVGGTEHAVLHLLYARFWHKVLYDLGVVETVEPFQKLFNQGMITADAYKDQRDVYVDIHDVIFKTEEGKKRPYHKQTGEALKVDPGKMGKRYKNGIPPEEICAEYSVDTFRCYEMSLGPLDASKPWQSDQIVGMSRFLSSVWRLALNEEGKVKAEAQDESLERLVHKTIKSVTEQISALKLNTALADLIKLNNAFSKAAAVHPDHVKALLLLIAPYAPHMSEQLMSQLYGADFEAAKSVLNMSWPAFDPAKCVDDSVAVPVQVNGKKRDVLEVPADITQEALIELALASEKVTPYLENMQVKKVIPVMKKRPTLVSIVVAPK